MDLSRRARSSVVSGSVWETRIKLDQVRGGIKVFNGEKEEKEVSSEEVRTFEASSNKRSQIGGGFAGGKRKTWKYETFDKIPILVAQEETDPEEISDERSEDLSISADGINKIPIQIRKEETTFPLDKLGRRSNIQTRKQRSVMIKNVQSVNGSAGENGEGAVQVNKAKSDPNQAPGIEPVKEIEVCVGGRKEGDEEKMEQGVEIEGEKKIFDIKEIVEAEPKKVVGELNKFHQINQKPLNMKQPPSIETPNLIFSKPNTIPNAEHFPRFLQTRNKLLSLVDLVMWGHMSRSALVFGFGTFIIVLSSCYVKDVNVSFISVICYLNLVYLAAVFLYSSLICRRVIEIDDRRHVLTEEEAIYVLKLLLPYMNKFWLKLQETLSGDPATTLKLAVVLFILAKCGSFITIWTMAKLGFLGVFTIPKICSKYSVQLTGYVKFCTGRLRDAWDSCAHKKALGGAIFVVVWNTSSVAVRIWAVFVAFVVFRYYQQNIVTEDWEECEAGGEEERWQELEEPIRGHRLRRVPIPALVQEKKGS